MISVSRVAGTSVRVVVPSASSAAAISFRTLFFAPVTVTSPARRAPPTTRNLSTGGIVGCRDGQPHPHLHAHRRRREHRIRRPRPDLEERRPTGGLCRLRRGQLCPRRRPC